MAFHPRGGPGPRPFNRGGQIMRMGMPPNQRMFGPPGRAQEFERFPPFRASFHGQFHDSRGPRPVQVRGGPRGQGFVSRDQGFASRDQGFAPRGQVPRTRFENTREVKEEPSNIASQPENKVIENSRPEELIKDENILNNEGPHDRIKSMDPTTNDAVEGAVIKTEIKEERSLKIELDGYNCDLHFNSDESGLVGWTLHTDGFEFLWGGARATHGVKKGKVCEFV